MLHSLRIYACIHVQDALSWAELLIPRSRMEGGLLIALKLPAGIPISICRRLEV